MKKFTSILLISALSSLSSVVICYFLFFTPQQSINQENQSKFVNDSEVVLSGKLERFFKSSAPNDFTTAAKTSLDAVVAIRAIKKEGDRSFGKNYYAKSNGSGVLVSADGYLVTNYHVIKNAIEIEVTLEDKREYLANLVGFDEETDIAVLKVNQKRLPYLLMGNSDSLQVGEWVLAIGNPFKLHSSVTAGIVSAKARNINILKSQGIESFIQTDAAINSGNSGGALINTNGELVGINTAIMSESGKYEGFSFAVPSNLVRKVMYDIMEFGAVQRGWMGINFVSMDASRAKDAKLDFIKGVYVDMVEKDGAAKAAGLSKGDVIVKLDNQNVNSGPEFMEQVASHRPGDKIAIHYYRNGVKKQTLVTLRNQLNTTDFVAVRKDPTITNLGLELRELDTNEKNKLNTSGVYVVSILNGSIISQTNMDPGYIITSVNKQKVSSVNDIIEVLKKDKGMTVLDGFYERYPGEFPYSFENN